MDTVVSKELKQLIERDEDTLVVNVLPRDAYEQGHIPGSINIPVSGQDFVDQVRRQSTGIYQPIVTYCAGPRCDASRRAAQLLTEAGFTQVRAYEGGMEEWRAEGHPVATGVAAL